MPVHSLLFSSAVLLGTANAVSYQMKHDYTSNGNFFDFFSFYDSASLCKNPQGGGDCWDPTSGAVHYVDNATARSDGLATVSGGPGSYQYTMKVDTRPGEASLGTAGRMKGRNSVRIEALPEYEFGKSSSLPPDPTDKSRQRITHSTRFGAHARFGVRQLACILELRAGLGVASWRRDRYHRRRKHTVSELDDAPHSRSGDRRSEMRYVEPLWQGFDSCQ